MKTSPFSSLRLCRLAGGTAALVTALLCSPAARAVQPHNPITPADSNGSEEWHSDKHDQPAAGAPVPEPSTWIMMGTLVAGAGFLAARSRSRARVTAS